MKERQQELLMKKRGHFVETLVAGGREMDILYDEWRCHIWRTVWKNNCYLPSMAKNDSTDR